MTNQLNPAEQKQLLEIARESLTLSVQGKALPKINLQDLPQALQADGASFVTLTESGQLRGVHWCAGGLSAPRKGRPGTCDGGGFAGLSLPPGSAG